MRLFYLIASAFLIAFASITALDAQNNSNPSTMTLPPVQVIGIESDMLTVVRPPAHMALSSSRNAQFIVNYNGFTPDAQAAFQFAVDIWASVLTSDVPIRVEANWEALPGNTLGQAGAVTFMTDFSGAPQGSTFYPIGLANKLAGFDLQPGDPDITASFNSGTNWYLGTDGNCPNGFFDLVSVVLHELGHGLGVQGSAQFDGTTATIGLGNFDTPIIFDRSVRNSSNTSILSFNSGTNALLNQLTGGNLFFTGGSTVAANGGVAELYAPSPFESGSSYSHWDESLFPAGNPNSLMTPFIGQAEVIHSPGPVTLAMLEDIGWTIDATAQCLPTGLTVTQGLCNDDGNGLLPTIEIVVDIDGACDAVDLCWGIDGATPTCANLANAGINIGDGGGVNLTNTAPNSTYEIYFTTADGQSAPVFFQNGDCNTDLCLPEGLTVTQGVCNDDGNGLLPTIEIVVAIDGTCDAVDLCWGIDGATPTCANLANAGINIGDGGGVNLTNTNPDSTYEIYFTTADGESTPVFFQNGNCDADQCLPTGLTVTQGDCQDDGAGLLPTIDITVDIDGDCDAVDLCWGIDGATPTCANLADAGINIGDGGGVILTGTNPNSTYEIYFTTADGQSSPVFFQNGNCGTDQCLPTGLTVTQGDCQDDGSGLLLPSIEITVDIDGDCDAVDLCWGIDGATPTCANLANAGINIGDGGGVILTETNPNSTYEIYFTTADGQSSPVFFQNGNCGADQCLPTGLTVTQGDCQDDGNGLLPTIEITVEIDGACDAVDLCWGIDGATPGCANLANAGINIGNGGGVMLTETNPNSTYEIYFTTEDGQSDPVFFQNGSCEIEGCTDPLAINYNPQATIDDGSCQYACEVAQLLFSPSCDTEDESVFYVDVNVTDLGLSSPYTLSNSSTPSTSNISTLGNVIVGPFDMGDNVVFTLTSNSVIDCAESFPAVSYDCLTGLDELTDLGVTIFPNPFNEVLNVQVSDNRPITLEIYSPIGKLILSAVMTNGNQLIDTSHLSSGLYLIRVLDTQKVAQSSFLKQ